MPIRLPSPFLFGMPLLPARRVIAIDADGHEIKLVLAELFLNRIAVRQRETLAVRAQEASAAGAPGIIAEACRRLGGYPVALALPQHLTLSQVIELPPAPAGDVRKLIENETLKLGGLSQTKITHDYAALEPFGRHQNSYWITLCQEKEFTTEIERLELSREDVCDATSVGNALRAAYLESIPATVPTVLADIGVRSTTVVILHKGQAVHVSSFAMGSEMLFEPVIHERNCTPAEAMVWGRNNDLLEGAGVSAALPFLIDNWHDELVRVVREWLSDHQELQLELETFQFVLSGEGASILGLVPYLNNRFGAPRFLLWPEAQPDGKCPGHYAVATGTAIQALGKNPQSASLIPADLRSQWKRQKSAQRLHSACFILLCIFVGLLGFGTWNKLSLARHKEALIEQAETALKKDSLHTKTLAAMVSDYEQLRPALDRQRHTTDILQTLSALEQVRSNRNLSLGLFADQQGYFAASPVTNQTPSAEANGFPMPSGATANDVAKTNPPSIQPHLIAEISLPGGGDEIRRALTQIVAGLKKNPRYRNVDMLPAEQQRLHAESGAAAQDSSFTIAFELEDKEFRRAATPLSTGGLSSQTNGAARPDAADAQSSPRNGSGAKGGTQ